MQKENLNSEFSTDKNASQRFFYVNSIDKNDKNTFNIDKAKQNPRYVDFNNRIKTKRKWYAPIVNSQSTFAKGFFGGLRMILEFLVVAWIVITVTFFLINSVPGSTAISAGLDDAQKAAIEAKYGLDLPLIQRYGVYLRNIFHGDFGISLSVFPGYKINDFIWVRFLKSFYVGIFSVVLTLGIGIPLGVYVGSNPDKLPDHIATVFVSMLSSIPSLVFALLLLLIGREVGLPYIFEDSNLLTYILPGLALSLGSIIVYIKYIRTELNRELNSQHAKFCYLKGMTKRRFVWKHALKPSLFPIATFFPVVIFGSFIGSMFVEQIFFITGSGGLLLQAITSKDYNIILFMVTLFSLITILSYTLRDILYEVIDPRVRRK
ncbi:ABC transporter permease [Mycoplasma crocodyli]|uniref:Oligopeptide ABC transporter, permease protein OppB n=1 Tax=Mycoplasma crocodyli (strain ATCC 51981 / MP145) TaxID=512564 RepID=D5E5D9_MYCCM|nr:ABC transporter permease [Mycoplasma crocodyli]ADE19878.1 oligopeptide ABC transporter, permease protein OppB [Mycoplasma crocodyli MP145]